MRYLITLLATASMCLASPPAVRVLYYVNQMGGDPSAVDFKKDVRLVDLGTGPQIVKWDVDGVPRPYSLESLVDGAAVDAWFVTFKEAGAQAAKPANRKALENMYFDLVEQVLVEAEDPRQGQTPPPKLSLDELIVILDGLYDTGTKDKTVTRLSVKLLAVDAGLKRYSATWWDDAHYHE